MRLNFSYHEICLNTSDTSQWICRSCGCCNKGKPEVRFRLIDNLRDEFVSLVCT